MLSVIRSRDDFAGRILIALLRCCHPCSSNDCQDSCSPLAGLGDRLALPIGTSGLHFARAFVILFLRYMNFFLCLGGRHVQHF
jgi:hypothetical protein